MSSILCSLLVCLLASSTALGIDVFLLGGQSNMVGQGGIENGGRNSTDKWDGVIPPEAQSNPSILRLNNEMKWEEAHEPLHKSIGRSLYGIGPGMIFANSILKQDPNITIGLVPCAVSGSNIMSWAPDNGTNYLKMLERARAAVALGGVLRGLLWYQGESDSKTEADANMYGARLLEFFNNFREDVGLPALPIIQVAMASGFDYKDTIRYAQLHTKLPNLVCVDAGGLELEPPSCAQHPDQILCLHLSTPAQVQLGIMLADAWLKNFGKLSF